MKEQLEAEERVIVLRSCSVENMITETSGGCCDVKELVVLVTPNIVATR